MLLIRRSSSPILKSLIPVSADTSPGSASHLHLSSASLAPRSSTTLTRAMSDSNISELLTPSIPRRKERETMIVEDDEDEAEDNSRQQRLLSVSGLDVQPLSLAVTDGGWSDTLVLDQGCIGDGGGTGGRICGGGGGGSDGGFSDSNKSFDAYYRETIRANPSDPLLLGNYSKYLKEVQGDLDKAEEYCERAILANEEEDDGGVLSMYAEIIWERRKDAEKAEAFFVRAVQAAPEDCYVAASYSRFLWDAEEEEERVRNSQYFLASWKQPSPFFPGQATTTTTPIAAAAS
ncbi:uncharacterized protein M6B38_414445 [Iris pallida]|uniref:Uncharacterized protein n=1 Tax=Iris pallida TaxID=29817 RepID=A0AAX6FJA1_IRIPA|nr:uncharacterized protein M6B38_414445 [Iris pallida]